MSILITSSSSQPAILLATCPSQKTQETNIYQDLQEMKVSNFAPYRNIMTPYFQPLPSAVRQCGRQIVRVSENCHSI